MAKRLIAPLAGLLLIGLLHLGGLPVNLGNDGLDLLFRLRGPLPPDQRIVIIGVDEPSLRQLGGWPFPRRLHAELLGHLHQARVIGFDFLFTEPAADDAVFSHALASGPPVVLAITHERDGRLLRPAGSISGYRNVGHIETILAGDGIVRQVDLSDAPSLPPAFSQALLRAAAVSLPPVAIPTRLFINYYGPEDSFLFLSFAEVLAGRYPADFFNDRLVLIGAGAVGLGDAHITSFTRERTTPGVEIQATIISNLLNDSFIRPLPLLPWQLIGLICLVAVTAWPTCGERVNLLINLGLILAVLAGAWVLFRQTFFFNFPQVLLFLLLTYLVHLVQQLLRAATRILVEAHRLDQKLDAGLHLVAGNIPQQYLHGASANPLTASAIQRHLDRLQAAVNALTLQHHFLENLLKEELPPLILWEDRSGRTVFANSAFVRFWREFAPEVHDLPTCRHFLEAVAAPLAETVSGEENHDLSGEPIGIELTGTGGRHFYQAALHPLLVPDTGFRGMLAVLQDITEIKELERVKDEVVAIVSHQLKLPLTTILGYGEILSGLLGGEHQLYAREICGQSRRLNRMIEDFLDIARLESGRKKVRTFPFPLGRMVDDAIATVLPAARKKSIDIVARQPGRTTPLLGDESLLLQAMINLLDNGIKFSPEHTTITVELEEQPQQFILRVIDQGPGIAREERQRIFDKFQRGNPAVTADGFGLGLHLVKQIMDRHHGTITVVDASEGAVFQLALPKEGRAFNKPEALPCG